MFERISISFKNEVQLDCHKKVKNYMYVPWQKYIFVTWSHHGVEESINNPPYSSPITVLTKRTYKSKSIKKKRKVQLPRWSISAVKHSNFINWTCI